VGDVGRTRRGRGLHATLDLRRLHATLFHTARLGLGGLWGIPVARLTGLVIRLVLVDQTQVHERFGKE
jgi:hypothetical protein